MRFQVLGLGAGLALAMLLGVFVGRRLSGEAVAVLAGVVLGVAASLPGCLLLAWAFGRRGSAGTRAGAPGGETREPVVMVLSQPRSAEPALPPPAGVPDMSPGVGRTAPRSFVVIGGDGAGDER